MTALSLRILLAEDNPINQTLARRLLEKQGHTVVVVPNGLAAVQALTEEEFDLVLMDVQMPEMDGWEAAAAIRAGENGTGRRVPIVALTALCDENDRRRCLQVGMDGHVGKPVGGQQLYQAIDDVLRRVRQTAE
jgi:two-component system sensor histidine kinase/response regulator